MKTTFDSEADAAYVTLTTDETPGRSARTLEVSGIEGSSVILDFDKHGVLLGVEVLGATRMLDQSFIDEALRIG